jgi:inner membrane protein
MDNLTHTLLGAVMSRAGLNRRMRSAGVTLMIAANLPDLDIVTSPWGNLTYLKYHRGITHSMVGVTALGLILASIVFAIEKRVSRRAEPSSLSPPISFFWIGLLCVIGTWSHLLLDLTNAYGLRPFLPFSDRWVAWDIEFIIDPILLAVLLGGLVLPSLFRLISEEVGAREKRHGRGGAIVALSLMLVLWGVRDLNHRSAIQKLSAFTYRGQDAVAIYALAHAANPFRWSGIVETEQAYFTLDVGLGFSALNLNQAKVFYKPEDSDVLRAARETETAKAFINFARLPAYSIEKQGEDTLVTIHDLRFSSRASRRVGFVATILLSRDLHVLNEQFSFAGQKALVD